MSRIIRRMIVITCLVILAVFGVLMFLRSNHLMCKSSITTASGWAALKICSGNLIFDENFDNLDKRKWQPRQTLWGGGNGEFQWYVADDENSFVENNRLHIKPTLTSDKIGRDEVENGYVFLANCTDTIGDYCERQAGGNIIINPIRSARLDTAQSFSFKYGRVEVIAKAPKGDWLWPAIWLMPTQHEYGGWPRSGEIDLFETRGNSHFKGQDGKDAGIQQMCSTLHFGPNARHDGFQTATYFKNNQTGFYSEFHKYSFIWNESGIRFFVDDTEIAFVSTGDGFWKRGGFNGDDIWSSGTKIAPFDQEFHLIINLAVGGTVYFPDFDGVNNNKPWNDTSPTAMKDFWINRQQWLPTWQFDNDDSSFIVDSVKVWAI